MNVKITRLTSEGKRDGTRDFERDRDGNSNLGAEKLRDRDGNSNFGPRHIRDRDGSNVPFTETNMIRERVRFYKSILYICFHVGFQCKVSMNDFINIILYFDN